MWDLSALPITPTMLSLIAEIDLFKGEWQSLGRLSPERLVQLKRVATIESIGSSTRIEGSKLSDRDVEKLLSGLESQSFQTRDAQEVAGYAFVGDEIFQGYEMMPLTENIIKQLHGWLLKYSEKDQRHRGEYKKLANNVEAFDEMGKSLGVVFETASPFDTPFKMQELIAWTRENLDHKTSHPLIIIGIFVVVFLAIHPFQDGNGRLSRLLTTLLLLKAGYAYVPFSSLESVIERNKEGYYLALRQTQGTLYTQRPDFTPWLHFFLNALQSQKIHLEHKVRREKELFHHLPPVSARIVSCLLEHGRLGIDDIATQTSINRNTLKKHLASLTKSNQIVRFGKGKSTWYTLA